MRDAPIFRGDRRNFEQPTNVWMSIKVTSWVWESADCEASDLLILLAMADFADDHGGNIFPSVATLAAKSRKSERAVQYSLRRLESRGLIVVEAGDKGHRPRKYRIAMPNSGMHDLHPSDSPGVQGSTSRGARVDIEGCNQLHPNHQNPSRTRAGAREAKGNGHARPHAERARQVRLFHSTGTWFPSWGQPPSDGELEAFTGRKRI